MVELGCSLDGWYIKDSKNRCKLVAKSKCIGKVFTLHANLPKIEVVLFAQGIGVVDDIKTYHN